MSNQSHKPRKANPLDTEHAEHGQDHVDSTHSKPHRAARTKPTKASLSTSPLSSPSRSIHVLVNQFQNYLHFPDPTPIYALMGCVAANFFEGIPIWLMLIGPPGSGKTQLLDSIMAIPRTRALQEITGTGSLLSGTGQKDKAKDATGGILREIGSKGTLVLNEFTSILSMPYEQLTKLLAAFRMIYDGRYTRDIGTDGARKLTWGPGKIAAMAGCTEAIDDAHKIMADMGERFIFFRFPESDGYQESLAASKQKQPGQAKRNIQDIVAAFFESLDLGWGHDGNQLRERRDLSITESTRIIALATFAARARSAVIRDPRDRTVDRVPQPERAPRLTEVFTQIYIGLEAVGLNTGDRWAVISHLALDSMPQNRRKVVEQVVNITALSRVGSTAADRLHAGRGLEIQNRTIAELQIACRVSMSAMKRVVEDLDIHGIVEKGEKGTWALTNWAKRQMEIGWGVAEQ